MKEMKIESIVNRDEQMEQVFIRTEVIDKILKKVGQTVERNDWLAITGDVGTGKSTLAEYIIQEWKAEPQKYTVVRAMGWKLDGSRINMLMKRMIHYISPDEHIPGDIDFRAERLKTVLMRAVRNRRKVILVIDEVQDLTEATLLELKKVHEIQALGQEHLFSIIMLGKSNGRFDEILTRRELGFRIKQTYTAPLTLDEMVCFAEQRFNLKFPQGQKDRRTVAEYFQDIVHNSPLGIKAFSEKLNDLPGFDGMVTTRSIRDAARADLRKRLKAYNISTQAIADEAGVSKATVSEINSGKDEKYTADLVRKVHQATDRLISEKQQNAAII